MPKKRVTAAEYLAEVDEVMRLILGDMIQNAATANFHWDAARRAIGANPEAASEHLAKAWVPLVTAIRVEREDALRILNRTMKLLDLELPDDDDSARVE